MISWLHTLYYHVIDVKLISSAIHFLEEPRGEAEPCPTWLTHGPLTIAGLRKKHCWKFLSQWWVHKMTPIYLVNDLFIVSRFRGLSTNEQPNSGDVIHINCKDSLSCFPLISSLVSNWPRWKSAPTNIRATEDLLKESLNLWGRRTPVQLESWF